MAQIAMLGLGYVGLTTAVGLANLGHDVIGIDVDQARVKTLNAGSVPIYEPGLQDLMTLVTQTGKLRFSDSYDAIAESTDIVFVAVATPSADDGSANTEFIDAAIASVSHKLEKAIIVIKSTVPIGTCRRIQDQLANKEISIVSNPEFLAEGSALIDFENPSRIVVGSDSEESGKRVMDLYSSINAPKIMCDLTSAETIKHASNAFLAIKLSYVNELAYLCQLTGAKMSYVTKGMSLDPRIGDKFLTPGPGWGGSCFPKDSNELAHSSRSMGVEMITLEAAIQSNAKTMDRVTDAIKRLIGRELATEKIAIWGLSFKANTGDTRESPAIRIAETLLREGAVVSAYDPIARVAVNSGIQQVNSPLESCSGATALIVLTEWSEFSSISPDAVMSAMSTNAAVMDTRGVLDEKKWKKFFQKFERIAS